jgi:hypothetical protein
MSEPVCPTRIVTKKQLTAWLTTVTGSVPLTIAVRDGLPVSTEIPTACYEYIDPARFWAPGPIWLQDILPKR